MGKLNRKNIALAALAVCLATAFAAGSMAVQHSIDMQTPPNGFSFNYRVPNNVIDEEYTLTGSSKNDATYQVTSRTEHIITSPRDLPRTTAVDRMIMCNGTHCRMLFFSSKP